MCHDFRVKKQIEAGKMFFLLVTICIHMLPSPFWKFWWLFMYHTESRVLYSHQIMWDMFDEYLAALYIMYIYIMWVKQCHKPSPSHHHFDGWSFPVMGGLWHCFSHTNYLYVYINHILLTLINHIWYSHIVLLSIYYSHIVLLTIYYAHMI